MRLFGSFSHGGRFSRRVVFKRRRAATPSTRASAGKNKPPAPYAPRACRACPPSRHLPHGLIRMSEKDKGEERGAARARVRRAGGALMARRAPARGAAPAFLPRMARAHESSAAAALAALPPPHTAEHSISCLYLHIRLYYTWYSSVDVHRHPRRHPPSSSSSKPLSSGPLCKTTAPPRAAEKGRTPAALARKYASSRPSTCAPPLDGEGGTWWWRADGLRCVPMHQHLFLYLIADLMSSRVAYKRHLMVISMSGGGMVAMARRRRALAAAAPRAAAWLRRAGRRRPRVRWRARASRAAGNFIYLLVCMYEHFYFVIICSIQNSS